MTPQIRRTADSLLRRSLAALIFCGALIAGTAELGADELPALTAKLEHARSEKARIAAVVSIGRLRDRRALRPLIQALRDPSHVVRSVAASALGHLGDQRALPALRRARKRDRDRGVRRRAAAAIDSIERRTRRPRASQRRLAHYRLAGREAPRTPEFYLVVESARDQSRGRASRTLRQRRAAAMREWLLDELRENHRVTLSEERAAKLDLEPYGLDLSITHLRRRRRGAIVEVSCEVRVAISDRRGKMLSFLTGTAAVQVPRRGFRRQYEVDMQKEAVENAVKSVHQDLVTFLQSR